MQEVWEPFDMGSIAAGWRLLSMSEVRCGRKLKGNLTKLLRQAASEGVITCPNCGRTLEPDAPKCVCGWENRLVKEGWV